MGLTLTRGYKTTILYLQLFYTECILQTYIYGFVKKTNGRIEIVLPVSILTCQSSSACHFASAYQILCESDHWRRVMTSLKFSR